MYGSMKSHLSDALSAIEAEGLFKKERIIVSVQDAAIRLDDGREVLDFCANNYLGLSSHPQVVAAAKRAIDERGFGMSSVRFIWHPGHPQGAREDHCGFSPNGRHHPLRSCI